MAWIDVKEKGLPKRDGQYLCWIIWPEGGDYDCCEFKHGAFWCYGDRTDEVTHWQKLPKPPVGGGGASLSGEKQ